MYHFFLQFLIIKISFKNFYNQLNLHFIFFNVPVVDGHLQLYSPLIIPTTFPFDTNEHSFPFKNSEHRYFLMFHLLTSIYHKTTR